MLCCAQWFSLSGLCTHSLIYTGRSESEPGIPPVAVHLPREKERENHREKERKYLLANSTIHSHSSCGSFWPGFETQMVLKLKILYCCSLSFFHSSYSFHYFSLSVVLSHSGGR